MLCECSENQFSPKKADKIFENPHARDNPRSSLWRRNQSNFGQNQSKLNCENFSRIKK